LKRVFIASSGDLAKERIQLETLLFRKGFHPVLWEALEQSITKEKFQERLNRTELITSDIVIFMVRAKFGEYTEQEFDFSYDRLGEEIERIYVYFFAQDMHDISDEEDKNIRSFKNKLEQKEVIHNKVKDFMELENKILHQKDYWELPQEYSIIQNTQSKENLQKKVTDFLTQQNELRLLQQTALKFLPNNYQNPIPDTVEAIVQLLFRHGKRTMNCFPLVCVLNSLYQHYSYESTLFDYREYLKEEYRVQNDCTCEENIIASDIHLGIEFSADSETDLDNCYSVVLWEYSNNTYEKSPTLEYTTRIDIENKAEVTELFNFLDSKLGMYENLYIELILPLDLYENEILVEDNEIDCKGLKEWSIEKGRRKEQIGIMSVYKIIYRIQDRFRTPLQKDWEEGWNSLIQDNSLFSNTNQNSGLIIENEYNNCLSTSDNCIITNKKVKNLIDILDHIEIYKVSIALIQLSDKVDSEIFQDLIGTSIKDSKSKITDLIRQNHANFNSNILFLQDNPHHRPSYATGKNFKLNQ